MIDDETLTAMLSGNMGVQALDAAREIVALRAANEAAAKAHEALHQAMMHHQDRAGMLSEAKAAAEAKMERVVCALADLVAGCREDGGAG